MLYRLQEWRDISIKVFYSVAFSLETPQDIEDLSVKFNTSSHFQSRITFSIETSFITFSQGVKISGNFLLFNNGEKPWEPENHIMYFYISVSIGLLQKLF